MSVTAVTFTASEVSSQPSKVIDILPAVARPSTHYRYRAFRYSRREAWLRSDVIRALLARAVPCFPAVLYVYRFVGAIAVVAVGAAEPSVVVDGIALVFRLPRFLYGRGDA